MPDESPVGGRSGLVSRISGLPEPRKGLLPPERLSARLGSDGADEPPLGRVSGFVAGGRSGLVVPPVLGAERVAELPPLRGGVAGLLGLTMPPPRLGREPLPLLGAERVAELPPLRGGVAGLLGFTTPPPTLGREPLPLLGAERVAELPPLRGGVAGLLGLTTLPPLRLGVDRGAEVAPPEERLGDALGLVVVPGDLLKGDDLPAFDGAGRALGRELELPPDGRAEEPELFVGREDEPADDFAGLDELVDLGLEDDCEELEVDFAGLELLLPEEVDLPPPPPLPPLPPLASPGPAQASRSAKAAKMANTAPPLSRSLVVLGLVVMGTHSLPLGSWPSGDRGSPCRGSPPDHSPGMRVPPRLELDACECDALGPTSAVSSCVCRLCCVSDPPSGSRCAS